MIDLLIITTIIMVIAFLISYFIKDTTLNIDNFASAGARPSKREKAVNVNVAKEFITKSQGLKLVQIDGSSASRVGINTNDIIAVDEQVDIKRLQAGDIVYLEYEDQPDKFKIREFECFEADFIFSKTMRGQKVKESKHPKATFKGVIKFHTVVA